MGNRLSKIFKIISFYDENRWSIKENYPLINFFKDDLDDDTKLLTHWFCYISDRQTPYQRIWDVGGFVYSDLVNSYKTLKTSNILDPSNTNSFLKKEIVGKDKIIKYYFLSKEEKGNNSILTDYDNIIENKRVKFKPRYLPSDYLSILYTLNILEDYEYSFTKFIIEIHNLHKDKEDFIKRMLYSLHLLTYYNIGRPKSDDISNFSKNLKNGIKRRIKVKEILQDKNIFDKEYKKFAKTDIYKQKRAWCSFRDFLKSPEFKTIFKNALGIESFPNNDFDKLTSDSSLTQLELPGDVWNNNSKFRKCILKDSGYKKSKKSLNKILREHYDNHSKDIIGYPEQFDITFNFVERMCKSGNCEFCPIYKIDNLSNNKFDEICIDDKNKYCSVIFIGCNYKNKCVGKNDCILCSEELYR